MSWSETIAALTIGTTALVIMIILGPLVGALSGLIVGIFFSTPILNVLSAMGIEGVSMWQLGAFLGFVGGFFKAVVADGRSK
jgi:hypothetical protein